MTDFHRACAACEAWRDWRLGRVAVDALVLSRCDKYSCALLCVQENWQLWGGSGVIAVPTRVHLAGTAEGIEDKSSHLDETLNFCSLV